MKIQQRGNPKTVVGFDNPAIRQITRIHLLSDPGNPAWEVGFVIGVLEDGTPVRIAPPVSALPKQGAVNRLIEFWPSLPGLIPGNRVESAVTRCI